MDNRPFAADNRALASGIIGLFLIIIMAALLYTLLDPAATDVFDMVSSQTTDSQAQSVIDEREKIWDLMLYFALFLAGIFIIARSVFEARSPG